MRPRVQAKLRLESRILKDVVRYLETNKKYWQRAIDDPFDILEKQDLESKVDLVDRLLVMIEKKRGAK